MEESNIQNQINALNDKMDILLDYVNQQRLNSSAVQDLVSDIAIIGKDAYDSTITELENQKVELDPDDLKILGIKLLKNIKNFNTLIGMFESLNDFLKDAGPIANEMLIDFTKKMHDFEKKGYFEFFEEVGLIMDNIITHYSREDVRQLADNIVTILDTIKNLTQPEMLNTLNNVVGIYTSIEIDKIPEYSVWKLMREMKKPEMKRGLGFFVTFMKNMAKGNETN